MNATLTSILCEGGGRSSLLTQPKKRPDPFHPMSPGGDRSKKEEESGDLSPGHITRRNWGQRGKAVEQEQLAGQTPLSYRGRTSSPQDIRRQRVMRTLPWEVTSGCKPVRFTAPHSPPLTAVDTRRHVER